MRLGLLNHAENRVEYKSRMNSILFLSIAIEIKNKLLELQLKRISRRIIIFKLFVCFDDYNLPKKNPLLVEGFLHLLLSTLALTCPFSDHSK